MKVVVFGGAGDMGSRAVEDLAGAPDVERVTIADRNERSANELAERLRGRGAGVEVKAVDASDHSSLVDAMRGHDVAASTLGPFYRFEAPLIRAALEAGVDYASICDDWSAAQEALSQFQQRANDLGRIVVTGLGTSPGVSNMIVRHFAGQMDKVRRVDVSVYQPLSGGGGEAVMRHLMYIISGDIAVWRGGQQAMERACSRSRVVRFPRFGRVRVWNMGHPEPVTVPRFIPGVEECNFFMGLGRGAAFFIWPARLGFFASEARIDWAARQLARMEGLTSRGDPAAGALRVDVWGEKDGEEVRRMACGVGTMREATALSLSAGVQLLARGELTVKDGGVYAPEACIDPAAFLAVMRAKGLEAYEDVGMTNVLA